MFTKTTCKIPHCAKPTSPLEVHSDHSQPARSPSVDRIQSKMVLYDGNYDREPLTSVKDSWFLDMMIVLTLLSVIRRVRSFRTAS